MQGTAGTPNPLIGYTITAVVLIVVLAIRLRRVGQARPLKVERLWMIPALYLVLTVVAFTLTPPGRPLDWAICAVALAAGAALGWQRGRLTHIEVDRETHAVSAKQSATAFLFIVILIALKSGMRTMIGPGTGGLFHVSAQTLTDILIAFALGLLGVQRLEMYLRARRLLAAARGTA